MTFPYNIVYNCLQCIYDVLDCMWLVQWWTTDEKDLPRLRCWPNAFRALRLSQTAVIHVIAYGEISNSALLYVLRRNSQITVM